jgi:hypothetical protein
MLEYPVCATMPASGDGASLERQAARGLIQPTSDGLVPLEGNSFAGQDKKGCLEDVFSILRAR